MNPIHLCSLLLFLSLPLLKCQAESNPYTPAAGSEERSAIMDSLRQPIQASLKKTALFKASFFKVQGNWAFLSGEVLQPDGKPMNYQGTPYEETIKEGIFEDWFCALLKKQGHSWKVVQWQIGATDVAYIGWAEEFHAPAAVFPREP